jgi:hypothetical protein
MDERAQFDWSHLFLVRLWAGEGSGDGSGAWRGKVQHLATGRAESFGDWASLVEALAAMIPTLPNPQPTGSDLPTMESG